MFTMTLTHRHPRSLLLSSIGAVIVALLLSVLLSDEGKELEENWASLSKDRTILVTGANSGLGFATVRLLAREGTAKAIILGCRNEIKCKEAQSQVQLELPSNSSTRVLTLPSLDLANRESILDAAHSMQGQLLQVNVSHYTQDYAPLDILINNAGVAFAWSTKEFVQGVETHLAVNHLGHLLLTHCLWNNLLASKHGARVVHVSSMGAFISWNDVTKGWYNKDPNPMGGKLRNMISSFLFYCQSKRANLMVAWELHERFYNLEKHHKGSISSVASHPGYTRSDIMLKWKLPWAAAFVKHFIHTNQFLSMSNEEGARTQISAALATKEVVPSGSLVGPKFWMFGRPVLVGKLMTRFSSHFRPFSKQESSSLWDESMKALGITDFGKQ